MNFLKDFLFTMVFCCWLFFFVGGIFFWLLYSCWFKGCCVLHNLLLESGVGKKLIGKLPSLLIKVTLKVSGLGLNGGCHCGAKVKFLYIMSGLLIHSTSSL